MWQRMLKRALALFQRDRFEREMNAEMQFHLECATEENLKRGMTQDEARRAARLSFGGVEQVKEQYRDVSRWRWLESFWRDVKFGTHSLRRAPGFTLVAVLTLALGIGATTTIFSVVYAVLLRPLPYPNAERIVAVGSLNPQAKDDGAKPSFNAPADFR
ncbi:MAG: permease, partial [Acidobacteria bacterium]|nr:permease [Acidobacteriota bacterium]